MNRSSIGGTKLAFWLTGISLRSSDESIPSDEGARSPKIFFRPFGPPFGLKIRGGEGAGPSPGSASKEIRNTLKPMTL